MAPPNSDNEDDDIVFLGSVAKAPTYISSPDTKPALDPQQFSTSKKPKRHPIMPTTGETSRFFSSSNSQDETIQSQSTKTTSRSSLSPLRLPTSKPRSTTHTQRRVTRIAPRVPRNRTPAETLDVLIESIENAQINDRVADTQTECESSQTQSLTETIEAEVSPEEEYEYLERACKRPAIEHLTPEEREVRVKDYQDILDRLVLSKFLPRHVVTFIRKEAKRRLSRAANDDIPLTEILLGDDCLPIRKDGVCWDPDDETVHEAIQGALQVKDLTGKIGQMLRDDIVLKANRKLEEAQRLGVPIDQLYLGKDLLPAWSDEDTPDAETESTGSPEPQVSDDNEIWNSLHPSSPILEEMSINSDDGNHIAHFHDAEFRMPDGTSHIVDFELYEAYDDDDVADLPSIELAIDQDGYEALAGEGEGVEVEVEGLGFAWAAGGGDADVDMEDVDAMQHAPIQAHLNDLFVRWMTKGRSARQVVPMALPVVQEEDESAISEEED